jgi:hypothetical protein
VPTKHLLVARSTERRYEVCRLPKAASFNLNVTVPDSVDLILTSIAFMSRRRCADPKREVSPSRR